MNRGKRGEDKRSDGALPSETSYASAEERRAKDRSGQEFAVLHLAARRDSNIGWSAAPVKAFPGEAVFSFPYLFPDSPSASVNTGLAADSAIKQYPIAFQAALFVFANIRARRTQIIDQTEDELGPKFEGGEDSTCSPMWSALEGLQDVVIHRAPKSAHR